MSEQEKINVNDLPPEEVLDEAQMKSVQGGISLNFTKVSTSTLAGADTCIKIDALQTDTYVKIDPLQTDSYK